MEGNRNGLQSLAKYSKRRLLETIELADGGILLYAEAFLPPDLANRYFVELRDTSVPRRPMHLRRESLAH